MSDSSGSIAEEVDDALDALGADSGADSDPAPPPLPALLAPDPTRRTVQLTSVRRRDEPASPPAPAPAPGLVPLDDGSDDAYSDDFADAEAFEEESVSADSAGSSPPSAAANLSPEGGPGAEGSDGREDEFHSASSDDGEDEPPPAATPPRGGVFRWLRSPSKTALSFIRAAVSSSVPVASSPPASSSGGGRKRRDHPDLPGADPARLAALIDRARRQARRRAGEDAEVPPPPASSGSLRGAKLNPVVASALTIEKLRASNLAGRFRAEASALRRDVAAREAERLRRLTPEAAKAVYLRRMRRRVAAAEGARRAAIELASTPEDLRAALAADLEESLPAGAARRSPKGSVGGTNGSRRSPAREVGGERGGGGGGPATPDRVVASRARGVGRHALVRRLWASHRLRAEAAAKLGLGGGADGGADGGAEAMIEPAPAVWSTLARGPNAAEAFFLGAGYDEDRDAFAAMLDETVAGVDGGEEIARTLRRSVELRREAESVLGR